jgi:hypothetical protein
MSLPVPSLSPSVNAGDAVKTADQGKPSIAYSDSRRVEVAPNLGCPGCGRELKAVDVHFDRGLTALTCLNCHADIITIERG